MKPDPGLLVDVVAPKVLDAWRAASEALERAGVRHVVIGGHACRAYLLSNAPALVAAFDDLVMKAVSEQ